MKRVAKVCGVILAAVCLLLLALFVRVGSQTFPPLPSPNGYDDFIVAGGQLGIEVGDANDMEAESLRLLIATNEEPLRLLQLGLTRTCSVPTAEFLTNNPTLSSDLLSTKRSAQLLAAVGRLAELEGRTNDAAVAYLTGLRYGNEISRGGFVIHRLVGIACEAIARNRLGTVATNLPAGETQEIIRALEKLDAEAVSWAQIEDNERVSMRQAVKATKVYRNPVMLVQSWWSARSMVKQAKVKHLGVTARRRLLIIELALRSHSTKHGSPPQQLGDLVPEYLARVPVDPFTKQSPAYRLNGTNWLLYSFGENRVDDSGNPRSDVRSDIP